MMNKILLLGLLLTPALWAQDGSEEAIILNQELQFLEESANGVTVQPRSQQNLARSSSPKSEARSEPGTLDTISLEQKYFGENSEEPIRSRAAAPKRRQ